MTKHNPPHPRTLACDGTCNNVSWPGEPQNDPMAAERARTAIADMTREEAGRTVGPFVVEVMSTTFAAQHTVTWERDVNSAGVPVRRYVARSAWEVDPAPTPGDREPVTAVLRRVLDEIHGVDEFGPHGAILRRDAEAIVRAVAGNVGVVL